MTRTNPSLIDSYDAFALDIDGVIWRSGEAIGESARALELIRAAEKPVLFLTNNSSRSVEEVCATLHDISISSRAEEVLTPAVVARDWILANQVESAPASILGPNLRTQIGDLLDVRPVGDASVELVFVSLDTEFDYEMLKATANAVRGGARLLAVNRDPMLPVPGGFEPGTGSILAAIEAASGHQAVVFGKPEESMMQAALKRLGPGRVLMVGDQPRMDTAGSMSVGWDSALVLTGVFQEGDDPDPKPNYIAGSLGELLGVGS